MSMQLFRYEPLPSRVVFGTGTIDLLGEEAARLGGQKILVLSTPQQTELGHSICARLGSKAAGIFSNAAMHTPVDVTDAAIALVTSKSIDCVIAAGGGSTTGLGKAIALRTGLPVIAVPTTYAGSEVTPILGETRHGTKTTLRDMRVLPKVVIYDVDLTLDLPVPLSIASGVNAIAHAVEALYAEDRNPIISLMAEEGARTLMAALPRIAKAPRDEKGRADALCGAWLCGVCLGQTTMGLHHKLCHTLGGAFNLPHAEMHTVMLPHTLAYNAPFAPEAVGRLARAFGGTNPATMIYDLVRSLNGPFSLNDLWMPRTGIDPAIEMALAKPYPNPRPLEKSAIADLLHRAWAGERPRTDK